VQEKKEGGLTRQNGTRRVVSPDQRNCEIGTGQDGILGTAIFNGNVMQCSEIPVQSALNSGGTWGRNPAKIRAAASKQVVLPRWCGQNSPVL